MRSFLFLASVITTIALAGCSESPRGRLHGKVTYQGQALPDVMVVFLASDNQTHPVALKADGTYEVDGVAYGPVKVSVQQTGPRPAVKADPDLRRPGQNKTGVKDEKASFRPDPPEEPVATGVRIPANYGDPEKSGLGFELKSADQEWSTDLK